jgi:hypothetical protein
MHKTKHLVPAAMLAVFAFVASFPAQTSRFQSPEAEYLFDIPDARWKITVPPSSTRNIEMVFGDRSGGYMQVRKIAVEKDVILSDLIEREQERVSFEDGFVAGREENFSGKLRGLIFNYEYVRSGRNMSGRFYFISASENAVYVLRFTGERDRLRSIRNQTDSIARTFELKKPS